MEQKNEKHANFIVNRQKDSANLIEDFGENIKKEVKSKLGIELEWEIKILGNRWVNTIKLCCFMEAYRQKEK